jgi:tetratricopeptide (TPR) repeat protein
LHVVHQSSDEVQTERVMADARDFCLSEYCLYLFHLPCPYSSFKNTGHLLGEVSIFNRFVNRRGPKLDKSDKTHPIISILIKEARHSTDHEHFENPVIKLQWCLQSEDESESRAAILRELGYCFLRLGWFEDAVKVYKEYLKLLPVDNDGRFFLASAYASLKWTSDAIEELRTILSTDPNDVLGHHDLSLCYRDLGWMKESLEGMKIAHSKAMIYGNPEEKEVVKSTLVSLEQEIENEDEDGSKETLLFFILLLVINKGRKINLPKPTRDKGKAS